jgi:SNF2 family DNA or RNA helicase
MKPFEKKNKDAIHALQSVMSEVLIRRTKNKKVNGEKIIKLPDKTINIVNLEFSKEERYLYDLLYEFSKGKFEEFLKR